MPSRAITSQTHTEYSSKHQSGLKSTSPDLKNKLVDNLFHVDQDILDGPFDYYQSEIEEEIKVENELDKVDEEEDEMIETWTKFNQDKQGTEQNQKKSKSDYLLSSRKGKNNGQGG